MNDAQKFGIESKPIYDASRHISALCSAGSNAEAFWREKSG
jgi:hypothetical protein